MKKLDFESVLRGRRYRDGLFLPDYPRDESGRFLREKTLEIIVREEYGEIGEREREGLTVTTKTSRTEMQTYITAASFAQRHCTIKLNSR